MGNTLKCQKIETEEEIIHQNLTSMNINELPCESVYSEYKKTFLNYSDLTINKNKYDVFSSALIGHKNYTDIQKDFFLNLPDYNITILGPILVLLSLGNKTEKSNILTEYYMKYYLPEITDFISDIIKVFTIYCIELFHDKLDRDNADKLIEVYNSVRIKRLSEFILNNYYQVKTKYMNQSIKDEKIVHEFFELSLEQLNGDYMRNWLYDDYLKNKEFNCNES